LQQVWLSASKSTFSVHCKHLKKYSSCRPERKKLSSGLANSIPSQYKSVKADTSMAWIKKSQSSLYRRHTGQELCLTVNLQGIPKHKSTSLRQAITIIKSNCLFRLSFHVVGKRVCLVMLWPNPARRDKPWNYIPLEFQRYTKLILATENLYGHVENAWGIPFPKKKK
jgi:hypothetical protein